MRKVVAFFIFLNGLIERLTIIRSLFRLNKTSCLLRDLDRPCLQGVAAPAPPCQPHSRPSLLESPLQRHWQADELHPALEQGLGRRCDLRITPLVNPHLPHFDLFGPSLGLSLLEGVGFSSFHHVLTLLLPLPFVVGWFRSEGLNGWRGGKPSLGCLPWRIPPRLGLQQLLES